MAAAAPRRGLVALFKKGWNDMPEVVGSCFVGVFGLALTAYSLHYYYQKDGDNRKYKIQYTVLRHDDPKVAKIRCD